ncbi:MAG: hypothetical protein AAGC84_02795 [Pseudomonas sp.]
MPRAWQMAAACTNAKAAGLTDETKTAHVCQAAEENRAYLEGR